VVVAANFLIDAESNLKAALGGIGHAHPGGTLDAKGVAQPDVEHTGHGAQDAAEDSKPAAVGYQTEGTLNALNTDGTVNVTHSQIKMLGWPGMTMDLALANPSLVTGIQPGTAITFEIVERKPGEWVITRLQAKPAVPSGNQTRGTDMLNTIIEWSARNRFLVIIATLFVTLAGIYAVAKTPLDALPDLSDVQVIVYTNTPAKRRKWLKIRLPTR